MAADRFECWQYLSQMTTAKPLEASSYKSKEQDFPIKAFSILVSAIISTKHKMEEICWNPPTLPVWCQIRTPHRQLQ